MSYAPHQISNFGQDFSSSPSYIFSGQNAEIEIVIPSSTNSFTLQSSEPAPYSTLPPPAPHTVPSTASGTSEKARTTVKEFGINLDKPKHPEFAALSVRIKTYENKWPEDLRQTPKELSLAGFFYGGTGDTVFCFFCGQGLHSWEDQDDPWEEHVKWSSKCVFLKNVKGPDYIEAVLAKESDPEKYLRWKKAEEEKEREKKSTKTEQDCRHKTQNSIPVESLNSSAFASVEEVFGKQVALEALKIFIQRKESMKKKEDPTPRQETYPMIMKTKLSALDMHVSDNDSSSVVLKGNISFTTEDLTNIVFDIEDGNVQTLKESIDVVDGPGNGPGTPIDEELYQLMEENLSLKKQTTCVICHSELVSVVFLPCSHICCCADCSPAMKDCPICKVFIKERVPTNLKCT